MDKKPLIGVSICAVVLLVLGSFTTVIGYQSVQSPRVVDSPLFTTRTHRAIHQQQITFSSQYIGKENGTRIYFPVRDNSTESLKRILALISKMDDTTFAQFMELLLKRAKQNEDLRTMNSDEIIEMLCQIRAQPDVFAQSVVNSDTHRLDPTNFNCRSILYYVPGCYLVVSILVLLLLMMLPIIIPLELLFNILYLLTICFC